MSILLNTILNLILIYYNIFIVTKRIKNSDLFIPMEKYINKYNINHYNILEIDLERLLSARYYIYKKCNSTNISCGISKEGKKKSDSSAFKHHNYTLPFPININTLVESKKICENVLLIFEILSKSSSFLERYAYRKIYSKYSFIKIYFCIGKSKFEKVNNIINEESNKYDDIIQFDVYDNYYNIVYQEIGGMRWINKFCKKYKYLIEQGSDIFFNIPLFYKLYASKSYTYSAIGNLINDGRVIRDNKSQFYIPKSVYNETKYPTYMNGPCQIFSMESISKIVKASFKMPLVIVIDDVYIGFLMKISKIRDIEKINRKSIVIYEDKSKNSIRNNLIFFHPLKIGCIYYLSQI